MKKTIAAFFAILIICIAGCESPDQPGPPRPSQTPTPHVEGLDASDGIYNDRIRIRWNSLDEAVQYNVFRSDEENGEYEEIAVVFELFYDDMRMTGEEVRLQYHTAYFYRVGAVFEDETVLIENPDSGFIDDFITFENHALEDAVRNSLKKWEENLYQEDLEAVTSIRLEDASSLNEIMMLPMLERLEIAGGHIGDFSDLTSCIQLRELSVRDCLIDDTDGLEVMTGLTKLVMERCGLEDIMFSAGLLNVIEVSFAENSITDAGALENLEFLETVRLDGNNIERLDCFNNLGRLKELYANDNGIEAVGGINDCGALRVVELSHNLMTTITGMQNLPLLERLRLNDNRLTAPDALSGLRGLRYLTLADNEIESILFLYPLTLLVDLDLARNRIDDISGLAVLDGLHSLNLGGNMISAIPDLAFLVDLEELCIDDNEIIDIKPLAYCTNLRVCDCDGNSIDDIGAFNDLENLLELSMTDNAMEISPGLPNYDTLLALKRRGCEVEWEEGNTTSAALEESIIEVIRTTSEDEAGYYYEEFTQVDNSFIYDCQVTWYAKAAYAGAVAGETREVLHAGLVRCPSAAAEYSIEDFVNNATVLPLMDLVVTKDPAFTIESGIIGLSGESVYYETGSLSTKEREFYIFKYGNYFFCVLYVCDRRGGWQVLKKSPTAVRDMAEQLILNLGTIE
ncbi:MAG: hypothetical protein JW881_19350 [Spirochaetales bacterium]|nr:hypothetical protein [Spirochaetales bacterium]